MLLCGFATKSLFYFVGDFAFRISPGGFEIWDFPVIAVLDGH